MEKSLFFNSIDGDRKYNASDFASYFSAILTNGVAPQTDNLRVVTDEAFNLKVIKGIGNINGYLYQNDEDKIISIEPQTSGTNRKDLIVLRLDLQNRKIGIEVKKDSNTLTREGMIYELCLAEISVKANATEITTKDINDTRFVKDKCGLISSLASINIDKLFDGDVTENVIKEINELQKNLNGFKGLLGQANGIALLDENCKIPVSNISNDFSTIYSTGFASSQSKLTIENLDFKKYKEVEFILDLRGGYYDSSLIVVKMNNIEVISIPKPVSGYDYNYMKARMIIDNSGNLRLGYFYNKDSDIVYSSYLISLFLLRNKILKLDTSEPYTIDITAEQINNVEIIGRL